MPTPAFPRAATTPTDVLPHLARRLVEPEAGLAWSPPPLAELKARIDRALAERRR